MSAVHQVQYDDRPVRWHVEANTRVLNLEACSHQVTTSDSRITVQGTVKWSGQGLEVMNGFGMGQKGRILMTTVVWLPYE